MAIQVECFIDEEAKKRLYCEGWRKKQRWMQKLMKDC